MTAFSLSANTNISTLSSKAGGDTYDTNGFNLTIDQHSRYGTNQTTSTSLGSVTINASKGGKCVIDSRYVRLIAYTSGTGNVPAYDTTISNGSASGTMIGVYSALTAAPTAPAAAMPASGYILVRAWNGTEYTSGALTGISATASGASVAGWLEIVGDESATVNANRLGQFIVYGAWYEFLGTTTTGTRTSTYQIPTNGSLTYVAGVMVQTAAATITAASWASTTAIYTSAGHDFNIGQEVTVTGASPSGYNVTDAVITAKTVDTFSVTIASNPGTWTSGGAAYVYEFYPNAGSRAALIANIQTDTVRGKWCWITTGGLASFGYDGTNSTGGYIPPSGRKLRVANVFLQNCTTAARTANTIPNATPATRYDFTSTGGGVINMDKCSCAWYLSLAQAYSVGLTHVSTFETMTITECGSVMTLQNVGIGQTGTAFTTIALTLGLNFSGGTLRNCTWTRIAQATSGTYVNSYADCSGFTFTNDKTYSLTKAANATSGSATITRMINCTFEDTVVGGGRLFLVGCDTVTWTNTVYYDNINGTTGTAIPMYVWDLGTAASYTLKFDGLSWGGQPLVTPYSGILNVAVPGCVDLKLRNLGTAAAPLDMGGAYVDATWTRSTTIMTVTKTAHGLKTGDIIAVNACSDVAPKALTTTTATLWTLASAPTADTFTVTVTNSGQTTGQNLSYYPCMASVLVNLLAGGATNPLTIQRCYTPHLRTGLIATADNSMKNFTLEDVWGSEWGVQLIPMLNCKIRGMQSTPALTAQTACYGTHFVDFYTTAQPASTSAVSWSRSTTTCTVTSTAHGLRVGDQVVVTVSSDTAAVVLGVKTLSQITAVASPVNTANTFQFTCLNAGGTSGTLTFVPLSGRVAIQMNEATTETASQVTLSDGAAFTSAGTLYMPTIGQYALFTTDKDVRGHGSFPIMEAVMVGGTISNYDITYSIDGGSTFFNLYYPRTGGAGVIATSVITMTSTTGVLANDYIFGTGVAPNAKVVSVDSSVSITVSIANTGTVSGTLRFNHLPTSTVADALVGFPLKVKIQTSTTNSTAISSVYFFTNSTSAQRAATYAMDTVPVTVTVLDVNTGAAIQNARVRIITTSGSNVVLSGLTNASGVVTSTTEYVGYAVTGSVRRATVADGTLYKPSAISATISASGLDLTVLMIPD